MGIMAGDKKPESIETNTGLISTLTFAKCTHNNKVLIHGKVKQTAEKKTLVYPKNYC
jgi:hypothetical protein